MNINTPNELDLRLLGVSGLSPWDGYNSSPRKQMFASHITQRLVIAAPTERYFQTGMEREYGKYTFSIKAPCNMRVHAIIDRYPQTIDRDGIKMNPQRLVLLENVETKEIDIMNIVQYCQYHQYFGFPYKSTEKMNRLSVNEYFSKDDIFMDTTAKGPDGEYMYGREVNMAFMSVPGVAEDGFVVSEDLLPSFAYPVYEQRVVEWGSKRYPLNLYGDLYNYKPFPDIGDYVREDSQLMVLRNHSRETATMDQSIYSLMMPDATYDTKIYTSRTGGRVVDIKVQHDVNSAAQTTPYGMDTQAEKYDRARRAFYDRILREYKQLRSKHGPNLRISRRFHRLVMEAKGVIENNETLKIQKLYRKTPLDDYRLEFTIEHMVTPGIGAKLTDMHGGKGVICQIRKPEDMPIDQFGNRVQIIACGKATINRMNLGRKYEHYGNAARRDVRKMVVNILMTDDKTPIVDREAISTHTRAIDQINAQCEAVRHDRDLKRKLEAVQQTNPQLINKAWDYLQGFYKIISPEMANWYSSGQYQKTPVDHLHYILRKDIYIHAPPNMDKSWEDIVRELEMYYPPMRSSVTYRGNSGQMITTVDDQVIIGSNYFMALEKTGDDWAAVSSAKTQCHGVLAQITNADKHSLPWRSQAIRAYGESEVRILVSYVGAKFTADILDRNNNPETHKAILYSIFESATPTNIPIAVNRKKVPMGGSKSLQLTNHILECGGTRFVFSPYTPEWQFGNDIITHKETTAMTAAH